MLKNTPNVLIKALFLGYGIYNNKTKNVYFIKHSHLMRYNNTTGEISEVYSPEEEINDTDWAITEPKI